MEPRARIRIEYADDDLRKRISSFLGSRHFPAFRNLQIEVEHGAVTVSGSVCSYYEKQVALNACRRVAGVLSTVDQINVAATLAGSPNNLESRKDLTAIECRSNDLAYAKPR